MKKTMMETALLLIEELHSKTGIMPDEIKRDDDQVLALFQMGSEINKNIGLAMIPMFDTRFAISVLKAVKPESYEDVRKIRALLNEGSNWVYTTLDMLEKGAITLKSVLADQTDYEEFIKMCGMPMEELKTLQAGRHVISRETADYFTDITWKLAYYKINDPHMYETCYKEIMTDFLL